MKKPNIIILAVLLVLVGIFLIIRFSQRIPEQQQRVLRDFAVQDTAAVDKIFLADKRGREVVLRRQNDYWTVNDEYRARRDFVNLLLSTFRRMEVSAPVPEARMDYVLRSMTSSAIKCEIYQHGKLHKTYYVGGVTEDNTGTYMIMENSDRPFVIRIPGFSGYLTVRYNTSVDEWRERMIFNYAFNEIHKVKVEYPDEPHESFIAINNGNNQFDIKTIDNQSVDFSFDTLRLKEFIARIRTVGLEAYVRAEVKQNIMDSLANELILSRFTIEDFSGEIRSMKTYLRPNIDQAYDDEGILYDYDLDRLFAIFDEGRELALIQYYVIDPISMRLSDFNK